MKELYKKLIMIKELRKEELKSLYDQWDIGIIDKEIYMEKYNDIFFRKLDKTEKLQVLNEFLEKKLLKDEFKQYCLDNNLPL